MMQSSPQTDQSLVRRLDKFYEFEKEPVSADKLQPGRYFAGLFAGENVAATEFVIGALFVQWGAGARDLILGLLLGNLLAVCSWAFICTPIAVRTRLTLYWYVRRIVGPGLTVIYNIVNGVLYCCLAAAMMGISASAVILALSHLGLHIRHPQLTDIYPNSIGWVIIVALVAAVVIVLAIAGFRRLSQFASLCSPWLFAVFLAGGLVTVGKLGDIHSLADLWAVFDDKIFTGRPGPDGQRLGFWHIVFFAWFCNLAMHIGLTDMALFRYARHWSYGFYSAFGMYLGHFLAWICAGIMGAALGRALNPGQMADQAVGLAGVLAVLIAGLTTANPVIYRAGLALQVITPNWPRWAVTLAAGAIAGVVGFFPAIFMRLLDFVAIYGLILMPVGAMIFVEHWLFSKLGLLRYWTERRQLFMNPAALIAWVATLAICLPLAQLSGENIYSVMDLTGLHLFFRALPGWFIAAGLYVFCAFLFGARAGDNEKIMEDTGGEDARALADESGDADQLVEADQVGGPVLCLRNIMGAVAVLSLAVCIVLPVRVFMTAPEQYDAAMSQYKTLFLIATVAYFIAAVAWAGRRRTTE